MTINQLASYSLLNNLIISENSIYIYINTIFYRKGYINNEDLKEVFKLLGETVTDEEVNSKNFIFSIIIIFYLSNDKDCRSEI